MALSAYENQPTLTQAFVAVRFTPLHLLPQVDSRLGFTGGKPTFYP
jgi:hypothetical protein